MASTHHKATRNVKNQGGWLGPFQGSCVRACASRWGGLLVFLHDGRAEMADNPVANQVRPIEPALFAGHDKGAAAWVRAASLVETCKLNRIGTHHWRRSTIEPESDHP